MVEAGVTGPGARLDPELALRYLEQVITYRFILHRNTIYTSKAQHPSDMIVWGDDSVNGRYMYGECDKIDVAPRGRPGRQREGERKGESKKRMRTRKALKERLKPLTIQVVLLLSSTVRRQVYICQYLQASLLRL